MSIPIDEEVYLDRYDGRHRQHAEDVRNGNPGVPQSRYAVDDPQSPVDRGEPRE